MSSNRQLKNKIVGFRPLRIFFALVFAFVAAPCVHAQQVQLDALAANVAEDLNNNHEKTVIVFDFVGPSKNSTALGQKVADDFSDALKKSSVTISVFDWSQITAAWGQVATRPILYDDETKLWFARKLGQGLMILGTIGRDGEDLDITVDSYSVKDFKALREFKVTVPLTEEMKSLMDTPPDAGKEQSEILPTAGAHGYSIPACTHCPPAQLTSLAITNHTQGTALLAVVVGADGRVHDIFVVKALPDGLTESAIKTVQSWKFKPALGPNGEPAAVRQTVEITFHLYK
jgi:TonB family protein